MSEQLKQIGKNLREAKDRFLGIDEPHILEAREMADKIFERPTDLHLDILETIRLRLVQRYENNLEKIQNP